MEGHPAVCGGQRAETGPQHFTGGQQFVEHAGLVVAYPLAEDQRFDSRGGHRHAGELVDHRGQSVDAGHRFAAEQLPGRQEAAQRGGADRFDLGAQHRQGAPAQDAQHLGVTPLLPGIGRGVAEFAAHQLAVDGEAAQHVGGDPHSESEPGGGLGGGERPSGAGEP